MFFFPLNFANLKKKQLIVRVQLNHDLKQIIIEIGITRSSELAGYPMFNGI